MYVSLRYPVAYTSGCLPKNKIEIVGDSPVVVAKRVVVLNTVDKSVDVLYVFVTAGRDTRTGVTVVVVTVVGVIVGRVTVTGVIRALVPGFG
jgi:hypothetical protein